MTISFSLAPNPKWYFVDFSGKPLGGGFMATFRALNPNQQKIVFQDDSGLLPWPYVTVTNRPFTGILIDANGTQGPFYFEFDTANPQETYFLAIYDSQGVLQWTINKFTPTGGGGGSIITNAVDLENLVINNVMYRNIIQNSTPVPATQFMFIAPGANSGLATTPAQFGPDIVFKKNNLSATDTINFVPFALGLTPFAPDETPTEYCNFVCGAAGSGEANKYFQFPITSKVQNLSGLTCSFTIWAMGSPGSTLSLSIAQFFGDGTGASKPGGGGSTAITPLMTFSLTSTWNKFAVTSVVPSVATGVEGACKNSGVFLLVNMPLNTTCNVSFTKPSMYLGNLTVQTDYHSYDQIDAIISSPRTGDIIPSMNYSGANYVIGGYIPFRNGTIGGVNAAAASLRRNPDTFPLFNMIYNGTSITDCKLFNSSGMAIVKTDAITDFQNGACIALPNANARIFANSGMAQNSTTTTIFPDGLNTGQNWVLGNSVGWETYDQKANEVGPHTHGVTIPTNITVNTPGAGGVVLEVAGVHNANIPISTDPNSPSGANKFLEQPTTFVNYLIKL